MSAIIAEWRRLKLPWRYAYPHQPKDSVIPLNPGQEKEVHRYDGEGVIFQVRGAFTSPKCGVHLKADELDYKVTVEEGYILGLTTPNTWAWVSQYTPGPPPLYAYIMVREFPFQERGIVSIFNDDTTLQYSLSWEIVYARVIKKL